MKIAILGTGGVGGYFGGKLALAGNDVVFLARGEHLQQIKTKGLTVKSINGNFEIPNVKTTDKIQELSGCELYILCVKAWQVKELSSQISNVIQDNSTILPLQNGILAAEELLENVDRKQVINGLCRIMSKIESPGAISHTAVDPLIVFGELDNFRSKRVETIKKIFDHAGINSKIADDIQVELWKKFISICAGGVLAVSRSTYGEIRELELTRKLAIDVMKEIFHLSQKIGVNIEPDYLNKSISFMDMFPYDASSSLARDVWEGKPSEIEYQNGTVVKLSKKYDIEAPVNEFIYSCILPMEQRARGK